MVAGTLFARPASASNCWSFRHAPHDPMIRPYRGIAMSLAERVELRHPSVPPLARETRKRAAALATCSVASSMQCWPRATPAPARCGWRMNWLVTRRRRWRLSRVAFPRTGTSRRTRRIPRAAGPKACLTRAARSIPPDVACLLSITSARMAASMRQSTPPTRLTLVDLHVIHVKVTQVGQWTEAGAEIVERGAVTKVSDAPDAAARTLSRLPAARASAQPGWGNSMLKSAVTRLRVHHGGGAINTR